MPPPEPWRGLKENTDWSPLEPGKEERDAWKVERIPIPETRIYRVNVGCNSKERNKHRLGVWEKKDTDEDDAEEPK